MKKKILSILIIICIILLIVSGSLLIFKYKKTEKEVKETYLTTDMFDKISQIDKVLKEINSLKKLYNNNDIIGILSIENTVINTPIVQTSNNSYYLSNSLRKEKSKIGSVFMDYRNNINDSKQLNIYGHNSTKYNPPFKLLLNYLNKQYYANNKYIKLQVNNETRTYEIFSIYVDERLNEDEHMQFSYKNDNEWNNHYIRLKNKSMYDSNTNLTGKDKIIVLQTCIFGNNKGSLLIIVGKQI